MKSLLFSAIIIFAGSVVCFNRSCGQTMERSSGITSNEAASQQAFEAQVQKELAAYPHGAWLYARSDGFSRWIDYEAALALGNHSERVGTGKTTGTAQASDTSIHADISHSADDEDEPSIAINRLNPNLIVAGANDIKWGAEPLLDSGMNTVGMPAYVTTDGGYSWKTYRLPIETHVPGAQEWGDPMIVCDNSGMFYYSFLMNLAILGGCSDIVVARSTDGIHWTLGNPVVGNQTGGPLEDKETIAVDNDPSSPYYGRLYIAWTEFNNLGNTTTESMIHYCAHSDDHGQTWSKPVRFTSYYGDFALIRVGYHGAVFIASMHYFDSLYNQAKDMSHGISVSTDGGATFRDYRIHDFTDFPLVRTLGRDGLKGMYGFRAKPYPCFDVDTGNVLRAVFGTYDSLSDDAALFETASSDLGVHWSLPEQIGTPGGMSNDHYMPWISTDPTTHETYISMSSSEEDTILNVKSRAVWCNYSTPTSLAPMGSDLFNTLSVTASGIDFLGDYATNDAYDGYFAASWTENRQPNFHDGEIFAYVSGPLSDAGPSAVHAINADEFNVGNITPNPATGNSISLDIASNAERTATICLFDLKGNQLLNNTESIQPSESNEISLNIHTLPAGVYHVQIQSGEDVVNRNLIILR